jgi:hypothetical protein
MIYQSRRKWGDPWKTCVNESDFVPNYFKKNNDHLTLK